TPRLRALHGRRRMAGRVAGRVEPRGREAAPHTPGDGTSDAGQVSWLPDRSTPGPSRTGHRRRASSLTMATAQWLLPVSFPVPVAGAAPGAPRPPPSPPTTRGTRAHRLATTRPSA